ncbi:DNA polymerase I [Limnoglobus roseus]|uniref:DNA polymerase I n=1 Tax=Limnoglobus roseus TaxID=2598579 RepID=A0A5C1AQM2_9BACT|nr:DNA polymerase I [Limnoglobus roseus]QEL20326.1 DNA polymerase I [Limnoglobus roseus]
MVRTAPPPSDCERVYLLDAHGLVFQMFHGIPSMTAPDGRPTNAVFGVTRAIMNLYEHGAQYLIAVFDHKDPTFREAIDTNYKAQRPPPPDDLLLQEPLIHEVLTAFRIPILFCPGFEADDAMATIAATAAERGCEVFLCTADKDCRQLLSDKVKILNLRKDEILDAAGLHAIWGVRPNQVIDFQSLVGDAVDNIPGVPGVGPKTATKWLQQYDTLDNLIAHADELGGPKVKEAFKAAIANGNLQKSKTLVTLRTDAPVEFDWENWKRREWDGPRLLELFQQFDFKGFANRVRATLTQGGQEKNAAILESIGEAKPTKAVKPAKAGKPPKVQAGATLFDQIESDGEVPVAPPKPPDNWKSDYRLVATEADFQTFLAELRKQKRFAIDLETTSLDPILAEIVGIAVSWKPEEGFYLAIRGPATDPKLDPAATLTALKPILEDPAVAKVNQNIKYDLLVFRSNGITLKGVAGDPMIAHYLLHAGERTHNLDDLTRTYFGHENISITELIGKGKKQISMADVPVTKACAYAAEDADAAIRLADVLEAELVEQKLKKLYDDVEIPLIDVLAEMEYHGVLIDVAMLAKISKEMDAQLRDTQDEIHALAGRPFNIASPKQLREILFDQMKLPVQKRTGTTNEPSTDQESLERLAALGYELPTKIIDHRQIAKLKGTYVDALPALVNPKTGRVHTSFNQTVASTGRLSSSDPNLQNIPMRTDQGRQIRQAFIPPPGWVLLTADYSQIELRLLAHFCGDEALRDAFAADRDVHTAVAAEIFKVPEAEVSGDQRRVAKTVNFGVLYGMSASGLAVRLKIPRQEAETFIDAYFARYAKVLAYQDNLLATARQTGRVSTVLGRWRTFDPSAIRPNSTYQQRNGAEREAINMEIQGSAADLMKLAMLALYRRGKAEKWQSKMLLSVHDELVFEVPPAELKAVAAAVREEMIGAMALTVPLRVDVSAGPNWLDGEDV